MTTLSGLFNKAKQVETAAAPAPTPAAPAKTAFKIGGANAPGTVKQESGPTDDPPQSKAAPTPAPKSIGGFKIGGGSPSGSQPAAAAKSEPAAPATESDQPSAPATKRFADETPASQPQRELPDDVSEAVKRFVENLQHLHTLTPEPDLASAAIRNIMIELKQNPQYIKHVMPDDVRVMIQMMRETMGLAKAVKEKKASTRKKAASAEVAAVMAEFADLDDLG